MFEIPLQLTRLIDTGLWPSTGIGEQELNPILCNEAAQKLSLDEKYIVLMRPPFHTIADEIRNGNEHWLSEVTNPQEIDYERALIFADFGNGSDSPIILYFKSSDNVPVMYLRWVGNGACIRHKWIETHSSFDEFAKSINLAFLLTNRSKMKS